MKNRLYLILLAVLLSVSCNKDENVLDPSPVDPGGSTKPTIQLTAPNGGEILRIGDAKTITWAYTGTSKLKLQYRKSITQSWILIADNLNNTGTFSWSPIPDAPSDSCSIRIVDMSDTTVADPSDALFKITAKKAISVVSPNGGESVTAKSSTTIRWTSANITNVNIQFSTNAGSSWNPLASSVPAQNQSYVWNPVPDTATNQYRIRVSDVLEDSIFDISDKNFSVLSTQVLQIARPFSGLVLFNGVKDTIRWTVTDVANVKIEYSTNNGLNWSILSASYPSSQPYVWTPASNPVSSMCKVRVSDAVDNSPSIESDVFTVTDKPNVLVLSPNGGEQLIADSSYTIVWSATSAIAAPSKVIKKPAKRAAIDEETSSANTTQTIKSVTPQLVTTSTVRIELSTDAGSSWIDIVSNIANSGSYLWKPIPQLNKSTCRIRVSDAQDASLFDVSDNDFTIKTPSLNLITPNGNELWEAGTTQNITWSSTGVDYVKIEFSTDGGSSYSTLKSSYMASLGSFSWSIPLSVASSKCKVRLSDLGSAATDASQNNFIVTALPKITVTKPNGGEIVPAGGSYDIQWTTENLLMVKIEYTTNNGSNWYTITDSTESDGFYRWNPVPIISAAQCRIRISDNKDGVPSDQSDGIFTIATQPVLKVVSPNGGERILANSTYIVSWNTSPGASAGGPSKPMRGDGLENTAGVTNIKLLYTADGGNNWSTIVTSIPNNGTYSWNPVPDINSALCKIKVQDASDSVIFDISDSAFVIYKVAKSLQVTLPNGGENIVAGSTTGITWSSVGVSAVSIDYTTNNGVVWNRIVTGTESDGAYSWNPIPGTISSTNCKIRVIDASDSLLYDESNNTFTILPQPTISVISPNGGELFAAGTTQIIRWSTTSISAIKIEFTSDGGSSWDTIRTVVPSLGEYSWNVPSINSSLCRIRVSNATGGIPSDQSDNNFTIKTLSLTLITPNGGEIWEAGTTQQIVWNSAGFTSVNLEFSTDGGSSYSLIKNNHTASLGTYGWSMVLPAGGSYDIQWTSENIAKVKIEYTINGGVSWQSIVDSTETTGLYPWNPVPLTSATQCKIRISDYRDGFPSDVSDGNFTIATQPQLKVIAPNGGERLLAKSSYQIRWNTNIGSKQNPGRFSRLESTEDAKGITNVKLSFTSNGGIQWSTIVANISNSGTYEWQSLPDISSALCKVKVEDATDSMLNDVSDSVFVIYKTAKSILVTAPDGGENLVAGSTTNITWSNTGVSSVHIDFTTNNGVTWSRIVSDTEGDGFYSWNPIPANITSTNCKIKVIDASDSLLFDESNAVFTIVPQPAISVISPNGGESYSSGTTQIISWTSTGVAEVKIELSSNNGASWDTIRTRVNSLGQYSWEVPSINSTLCRVRISNATGGIPSDISDNNFTITTLQPQSVRVTRPNGLEIFTVGSVQNITWSSSGIDTVKLEMTTNNGVNWTTIINKTQSNGLFAWTVPNSVSTNCKIRVSDANDATPSDVSDSSFTIEAQPVIAVTTPNGGERILSGSTYDIRWSSVSKRGGKEGTEAITNVKLEFSADAGSSWSTIAATANNTGLYQWNPVPNISSSLCRIRISDAEDGIP
ncbi:MAG: hypothetical protein HYV28_01970, partial [Ignavibacteriales bacterium]|nr:hypothetical protein [Ignavibacteriales bacterium]